MFPCVGVCGYPVRTECGNACGSQDLASTDPFFITTRGSLAQTREAFSFASFLLFRCTACRKPNGGKTIPRSRARHSNLRSEMQNLLLVAQFAPFRSGSLHAAQRMELAADPSSPVLPQRCPSTARPSTATVESDPAASVLQATTLGGRTVQSERKIFW